MGLGQCFKLKQLLPLGHSGAERQAGAVLQRVVAGVARSVEASVAVGAGAVTSGLGIGEGVGWAAAALGVGCAAASALALAAMSGASAPFASALRAVVLVDVAQAPALAASKTTRRSNQASGD